MFSSRKTSAPSTGYNLTKSLRFRSSASAYLSRTPASATNQKTWTFSAWLKRGTISTSEITLFGKADTYISVNSNQLNANFNSGGSNYFITSSAVLVDPSAWYHVVLVLDTTQATAANRASMYVNGVKITSFATSTYTNMAQNYNAAINTAAAHAIGRYSGATPGAYLDGYLAEVNFIDGQALTASSFGSFSGTGGVWQPIAYSGTYGTNGFHLTFANTTSTTTLGYDTSGNSNNWTTNNISLTAGQTYDSMNDVPTLTSATASNYAVLNPNDMYSGMTAPSNGNLTFTSAVSGINRATIAPSSNKWYFEVTFTTIPAAGTICCGVKSAVNNNLAGGLGGNSGTTNEFSFGSTGYTLNNNANTYQGITFANGDVMNIAFDLNAGYIWFGKNGTWISSGNPATGANPVFTTLTATGGYAPAISNNYTYSNTTNINFGQQPFTYTPPSGYVALNTYNLPTPSIAQGNNYMDATLYTGTGASASITNTASFKPDLVWIKSRSAATDHKLTDSVRGVTKGLISDTTGAETTDTQGLTAFNSNGFTLGTDTNYNNSGATYVGWQWQAGAGTSGSNTNGSITSTVSANTTAGFSIVTYTGTGSAATIGHGLGVAPSMIIVKARTSVVGWPVYHITNSNTSYLLLNATDALNTAPTVWNNTDPTSSVFSEGGSSGTGSYSSVAYCFAPIAGYSAFGQYVGNGSATGPFVYCGFQPKFILIKSNDVGDWVLVDTRRNPYNTVTNQLAPSLVSAETTTAGLYINALSNGFQVVGTGGGTNTNGIRYIYACFASNPFKYSNAF